MRLSAYVAVGCIQCTCQFTPITGTIVFDETITA